MDEQTSFSVHSFLWTDCFWYTGEKAWENHITGEVSVILMTGL